MNTSRVLGAAMVIVSGVWLYYAHTYSFWVRIFPQVMGYVLLAIGLLLLVQSVRAERQPNPWAGADYRAVALSMLVMVLYVASLELLGFLLGSVLMFMVLGFYLGPRSRPVRRVLITLAFSVGLTGGLYVIFVYLFNVPLPRGAWI